VGRGSSIILGITTTTECGSENMWRSKTMPTTTLRLAAAATATTTPRNSCRAAALYRNATISCPLLKSQRRKAASTCSASLICTRLLRTTGSDLQPLRYDCQTLIAHAYCLGRENSSSLVQPVSGAFFLCAFSAYCYGLTPPSQRMHRSLARNHADPEVGEPQRHV
jgi:hypothetical protein